NLPACRVLRLDIWLLDEHPTADGADIELGKSLAGAIRERQDAGTLLLLEQLERIVVVARRDDDIELDLPHLARGFKIDWPVQRDDPAEGGNGVTFIGGLVGIDERVADGKAARDGVLDNADGWSIEELGGVPRRVCIQVVVEGKILALELLGLEQARSGLAGAEAGVGARLLVRILAVLGYRRDAQSNRVLTRKASTVAEAVEVFGDQGVVGRDVTE